MAKSAKMAKGGNKAKLEERKNAARLKRAINLVKAAPDQFEAKFAGWLAAGNWSIYLQFEQFALLIAKKRGHYGAKGIWEVIRYHTVLAESDGEFKLNNNWHSPCARLFAAMHPAHRNLFEFRERISLRKRAIA